MSESELIITGAVAFGSALGGAGLGAWLTHLAQRRRRRRDGLVAAALGLQVATNEWSDLAARLTRDGSIDPLLFSHVERDLYAAGYRVAAALADVAARRPDWVGVATAREEFDTALLVAFLHHGGATSAPGFVSAIAEIAELVVEAAGGDASAAAALRDADWTLASMPNGIGATDWIEGHAPAPVHKELLIEVERLVG